MTLLLRTVLLLCALTCGAVDAEGEEIHVVSFALGLEL